MGVLSVSGARSARTPLIQETPARHSQEQPGPPSPAGARQPCRGSGPAPGGSVPPDTARRASRAARGRPRGREHEPVSALVGAFKDIL